MSFFSSTHRRSSERLRRRDPSSLGKELQSCRLSSKPTYFFSAVWPFIEDATFGICGRDPVRRVWPRGRSHAGFYPGHVIRHLPRGDHVRNERVRAQNSSNCDTLSALLRSSQHINNTVSTSNTVLKNNYTLT